MDGTPDSVVRRLERVERENRRLKRWGSVMLLGIACLTMMGQTQSGKTVEAERFVVRDTKGKVRAELGAFPEGKTALVLYDQERRPRVEVRILPDGRMGLAISDENERPRAILRVLSTGAGVISLFGSDGKLLWQRP